MSRPQNEQFGEGVSFERIRRISGYLVGDYKARFNDAKKSECEERVKHENSLRNSHLQFHTNRNNLQNIGKVEDDA